MSGEYLSFVNRALKPALNKKGGFPYSCRSESSLVEHPSRLLRIDAEQTAWPAKAPADLKGVYSIP